MLMRLVWGPCCVNQFYPKTHMLVSSSLPTKWLGSNLGSSPAEKKLRLRLHHSGMFDEAIKKGTLFNQFLGSVRGTIFWPFL